MKGNIALLVGWLVISIASCGRNNKIRSLEQVNTGSPNAHIDSTARFTGPGIENYCFEVEHDRLADLSKYHLMLQLDGAIVYSGNYQARITVPFTTKQPFYTLVVFLYDKQAKLLYAWSNKDVYKLKTAAVKCYSITLLSFSKQDNANGYQMNVD